MADTATPRDPAGHVKAVASIFSSVFAPEPFLKAQADLLADIERISSGWLQRRQEAAADAQQLIARLSTVGNPFEALKAQQEWVSRGHDKSSA